MDLIVSGSRYFNDYPLLENKLLYLTWRMDLTKLVLHVGDNAGNPEKRTAGADALAAKWSDKWMVRRRVYRAEWKKHGRAAGPMRNKEMLTDAGPKARLVAFWDGRKDGCGTWDMIQQARRAGIKIKIIRVQP